MLPMPYRWRLEYANWPTTRRATAENGTGTRHIVCHDPKAKEMGTAHADYEAVLFRRAATLTLP